MYRALQVSNVQVEEQVLQYRVAINNPLGAHPRLKRSNSIDDDDDDDVDDDDNDAEDDNGDDDDDNDDDDMR